MTSIPPGSAGPTVFLLSPAQAAGRRAQTLLNASANFPLARRLRDGGASLGEVFSFVSGLYFRGKLTYATRFASPTVGGIQVITTNRGLLPSTAVITVEDLRSFGSIDISADDPQYRAALERDIRRLPAGRIIFLGSIATTKYLAILVGLLGDRLYYPRDFVGRGDMSRGAMLLDAVRVDRELPYLPAADLVPPEKPRGRGKKRG